MSSSESRRQFLRVSYTVGAGLAIPGWLAACNSDGSVEPPVEETFVEPDRLMSDGGLLDTQMRFAYADNMLGDKPVYLRAVEGRLTGPTLDVNAGDMMRVNVHNDMPPNPASTEPDWYLRYPNNTNFHTHGLHVNPGIIRPGVYGDYVIDDPREGIQPGTRRQHEFAIPIDHPPGTYWYHPHLHGTTALHVGSGMAGAIIIRGAIDEVPEIAAARERLFVFQAIMIDASGRLENFADLIQNASETPFTINGVRRPRLVMRPGEVQKWRFINTAVTSYLNLALDGHELYRYAHDGNPHPYLKAYSPDSAEAMVMAPGNRNDLLVKASDRPGTYYLRTKDFNMGFPVAGDILAEVVVTGQPMDMALPSGPLPTSDLLRPISDEELAAHGGLKREIVMREVYNADGSPITEPPAADLLPIPAGELPIWSYQTGDTFLANTVYTIGANGEVASPDPQMPTEYIPFQSSRALKQTVALGSVEEWTVYNMGQVMHPLHIHVNPFEVIKINGEPVEPYWADTIPLPRNGTPENPTSVTFRTRFLNFRGTYVMHCHLLVHEDSGMMQLIEVV